MADSKQKAAALKDEGNREFSAGNYEKAADLFSQAIALDASNHVLYSNRSGAYAALKRFSDALKDAEKTIELQPSWFKGYSRKGAALWGLRKLEEAAEAYREGLKHDASNASLQSDLSRVMEEIQEQKSSPLAALGKMFNEELWAKIALSPQLRPYMNQPDFVAKVKALIENPMTLQMHLNDPRIQQLLSIVLGIGVSTADDPMEADAAADAPSPPPPPQQQQPSSQPKPSGPSAAPKPAEAPKPKDPAEMTEAERVAAQVAALKEKGTAAYKARRFDEALQHYREALALDASNVSVLLNISAVEFETEKYRECIETCAKALEAGRAQRVDLKLIGRALSRQGSAHLKLGELEEAIRLFKQSLLEDRNADTLKKLQDAEKLKKQRDEEAYFDADKALEARKLGNTAFGEHRYPEAVQHYTEAIKRNPREAAVYSNRAAAYMKLGAPVEAIRDCDKCLELDPKFVKAFIRKGLCQLQLKEYHRALETFQKGLQIDSENSELREGLEKTLAAINAQQRSGKVDEEQVRHAMADPEIRGIVEDPAMQRILQEMNDPTMARQHLTNPVIRDKINKLVAAGIVQLR